MITDNLRSQFLIRKDICFLNFGSFGACPKPIFNRYQEYQLELEQEPVQFIVNTGMKYIKKSREVLSDYVSCHPDDLVFVTNPSYAVNIIAKSFDLKAGDEILTTDLEYGACDRTWKYYCDKVGAKYIQQHIQLPLSTKEAFVEEFFKACTPKTKLIFISHITSSTGLLLPVEAICAEASARGILSFVDGAHAPGQIPLNLNNLGASIYTGACHKWMMAPKGCSFLYVHKSIQNLFDPLVVSWGYNSAFPSHSLFLDYHQTQGTRDFSAFCTIPTVLEFMEEHHWEEVAKECRALTLSHAQKFCDLLQTAPIAPITTDFIVQLYSIPIHTKEPELLKKLLFDQYKIEVPIMRHGQDVYLRYSIQAFNTEKDLANLYNAIEHIIKETNLISLP
jgi:isopenicillin-N epimerase